MAELFEFDTVSILAEPLPNDLSESDPRRPLEASKREARLLAGRNDADPLWLLNAVEFFHDTGRYPTSISYASRMIAHPKATEGDRLVRALCFQCMNYLAIADGPSAERCADRIAKLAVDSSALFVTATHNLIKGMNRQYNVLHMKQRQLERGAEYALPLFEDAAESFNKIGEIDLAIRAQLELARSVFELGRFFQGVSAIDQATQIARDNLRWNLMGRILLLFASNASDMGYRIGVEDAIRRSLAWCDYLGDAWSRIEALTVLGRFLYYTMPAGESQLAHEPDSYLHLAATEADALGLGRLRASIDSTRFFLFRKAGDDRKVQQILGDVSEEEEFRQKQLRENRQEIEKIGEARRQKTALRLHDGVEDSQDAFFVFDALRDGKGNCRDFGWAYVNREAVGVLNQSPSQVYLYSEARRIPQLGGLDEALVCAVEDREIYEDTCEFKVEGDIGWLQRRVVPSGDGAVVTLHDVTAEKRIESVLRHAAESAMRSETAKTAFLASMSHEIRTPLNGVLGLARMLSETELDANQRAFVDDIVLSGNILLELIGDVLDLSKIEANQMQLSQAPVSLPGLVASVVSLFHGQAHEKGTALKLNIDSGVPETVLADALRLRQILSNLVGNAVKFTEGGSIQVNVTFDGRLVAIAVQDTGIGISPDHIESVFDRFHQVNSVQGGSGLGLAITKALAELMGGEVTVASNAGNGSTFLVQLPLQKARPKSKEPEFISPDLFKGRRVLIVDDNQINLLVSAHAIQKFGCETICAKDGSIALDILAGESFDIVFLDVQMPGLSGLDVCREVRRREAGEFHTPIIALTAGALLQEQHQCFEAGMDDFVTKPISLEAIQSVLTKWLQGK